MKTTESEQAYKKADDDLNLKLNEISAIEKELNSDEIFLDQKKEREFLHEKPIKRKNRSTPQHRRKKTKPKASGPAPIASSFTPSYTPMPSSLMPPPNTPSFSLSDPTQTPLFTSADPFSDLSSQQLFSTPLPEPLINSLSLSLESSPDQEAASMPLPTDFGEGLLSKDIPGSFSESL